MLDALTCFKAYDIRGKLTEEINEEVAYNIGRAFAEYLDSQTIVVGGDNRLSSETLKKSLTKGIVDTGCDVIDLGLTGTEEIYFATTHLGADGGVQITASHNPKDYNGMKLVKKESRPISNDNGLLEIKNLAESQKFKSKKNIKGEVKPLTLIDEYTEKMLSFISVKNLRPLKVLTNAGNGSAGHVIDSIERSLKKFKAPIEFIKINNKPDGHFPHGIPNPLLVENRELTSKALVESEAQIGLAWDGDFDRCFFFDENGRFIEGYYIVGLLAEAMLKKHPKEKIIHDPRLTWNTIDVVNQSKGFSVSSKTGHAFMKDKMRIENAIYGGEMSAHHYFRDFSFCDSGMIPWLLILELVSTANKPLSFLVNDAIERFPCSGEINFKVSDTVKAIERVSNYYIKNINDYEISHIDGLSMEFNNWRFNLRSSNTEPLIRLNVESRGDRNLLALKVDEITSLILAN